MLPEAAIAAMIKGSGAVLGAALALMFQPPQTLAGMVRRVAIAVPSGLVFHEPLMTRLGWAQTAGNEFAAIVLASALSWWVFGAAVRILEIWKPK